MDFSAQTLWFWISNFSLKTVAAILILLTGGVSGTIRQISIFNTELSTPDNQQVLVPNSAIMGNVITNVTANPTRRIDLTASISYGENMRKAKDVLARILKEESRVLASPAAVVAVAELGANSVNLVVRPWVNTGDYWDVRFDLTEKIKAEFDREGIAIPFPQQDVHLFVEKQLAG
ncbi:mechanosensitive ion channel family protein [Thiovibrio sp. JS02]